MSTDSLCLRKISLAEISGLVSLPKPRIRTDTDVETWRRTRSYQDYGIFLRRLNESVVGHYLPLSGQTESKAIAETLDLLNTLDGWIDEIPPQDTPQRFGNLAFRTWGQRLEERADDLLNTLLSPAYSAVIPHVKPYLMTAFGSFTRMDYGTGHEASFALFVLCLTLVRFFRPVVEEERELVLRVFVRYMRLCWRLQDVYKLEPAGSHGVWGLDDSSFLAYIFGSGELRDQTDIPVSKVLQTPLPPTNLYFMSIMRIHEVKHGPFSEHSPQLHSIAVGVPNWNKVNSGLFKMYEAEVLGKRVVVQHIPLGGLLEWDLDASASGIRALPSPQGSAITTQVPWTSSSSGPPALERQAFNTASSTIIPSPPPHGSSPMGISVLSRATGRAVHPTPAPSTPNVPNSMGSPL